MCLLFKTKVIKNHNSVSSSRTSDIINVKAIAYRCHSFQFVYSYQNTKFRQTNLKLTSGNLLKWCQKDCSVINIVPSNRTELWKAKTYSRVVVYNWGKVEIQQRLLCFALPAWLDSTNTNPNINIHVIPPDLLFLILETTWRWVYYYCWYDLIFYFFECN